MNDISDLVSRIVREFVTEHGRYPSEPEINALGDQLFSRQIGNCPTCGQKLVRAGHENTAAGTKGRYTCMNRECTDKRWFNRSGKPRFGG